MTVGERLKEWRKSKGLTTLEIKEKTGISTGGLSEYENDKKLIGSKTLITLYEYYGIDINYILTGERKSKVLAEDEERVLEKYRGLSENEKGQIEGRMDMMLEKVNTN